MCADDTSFFLSGGAKRDLSVAANMELDKISKWMKVNKLSVNTNKTLAIRFTNRRVGLDELNIVMNGQPITLTDRASLLGVILDHKLKWHYQIDKVVSKVSKCIGVVFKVKHLPPEKTSVRRIPVGCLIDAWSEQRPSIRRAL